MLARRSALARIGGFEAIRGELIDDCSLAAKIKAGGSIRLDLADDSISLRPYDDWQSLWNMIARSAYTQLHYSPWMLIGATLGMILTYLAPPVLALAGGADLASLAGLAPDGHQLPADAARVSPTRVDGAAAAADRPVLPGRHAGFRAALLPASRRPVERALAGARTVVTSRWRGHPPCRSATSDSRLPGTT
jgi:hypothetical protein